jgi:hypothetical protein
VRNKKLVIELARPFYNNRTDIQIIKKNLYSDLDITTHNFYKDYQYNNYLRDGVGLKNLFSPLSDTRFKIFFKSLAIDTPQVLNTTTSLKRKNNDNNFRQLAIRISRHGKRTNALNLVLNALFNIFKETRTSSLGSGRVFSFNEYYLYSTFFLKAGYHNPPKLLYNLDKANLNFEVGIEENCLFKPEELSPENLFRASLKVFNFLFSFYIYKVDKSIYKNSRGKSGKYTFV